MEERAIRLWLNWTFKTGALNRTSKEREPELSKMPPKCEIFSQNWQMQVQIDKM